MPASTSPSVDLQTFAGRSPESLSAQERKALHGCWIALELYTPQTTPLRRIEAIGRSCSECLEALAARGLDARQFEFTPVVAAF